MSAQGTVKFFNSMKGYGFITQENGGADLFVHANDVQGQPLQDGDVVQYDANWDERKQKENAINVTGGTGDPNAQKGGGKGKGKSYGGGGYGGGSYGGGYGGGGSYGGGGYGGY